MLLFLSVIAGVLLFHIAGYFPLTAAALLIAGLGFSLYNRKPVLILLVIIAFLYSSWRAKPDLEPFVCSDAHLRATVKTIPATAEYGFYQKAVISRSDCGTNLNGREAVFFSRYPTRAGSEGIFLADIKGVYEYRNPGNFRTGITLSANVRETAVSGESGFYALISDAREKLIRRFQSAFSPEPAGLLSALVAGENRLLPDPIRKSFSSSGLAHLLSISGTHFGIFSFLIFSAIRFPLRRIPYKYLTRMTLRVTPSEIAAVACIPILLFYLFLSGAGIPAVRSFIMVNLFLFGLLLGRKGTWKNSLALAAVAILLIWPDSIFDISFMLSFAAVASIGFAADWRQERHKDDRIIPGLKETPMEKVRELISGTLLITVAATAGTLPFVLYFFHQFPVISPLANLLIAPLVCFLIVPLAVLASFIYLITGFFPFVSILGFLSRITLLTVRFAGGLPFASLPVAGFPTVLLILFLAGLTLLPFGKARRYGLAVCAFALAGILIVPLLIPRAPFELTFLDTGQAESSVLVLPDKKVMVIDTGKDGRQTAGFLDYLGRKKIDAVFLTHEGSDHAGGTGYLVSMKKIGWLIDNGAMVYNFPVDKIQTRTCVRGNIIEGKGYRIEVLHPYREFYSSHSSRASAENNNSLVLRIDIGGTKMLFTGDIESEAEEDLVALGNHLRADILKVPHHGSNSSSTEAFLVLVNPSLAVISSGMFNPYGHPGRAALARLSGIRTLNTAQTGAIKITGTGNGFNVKTFEDFSLKKAKGIGEELRNYRKLVMVW